MIKSSSVPNRWAGWCDCEVLCENMEKESLLEPCSYSFVINFFEDAVISDLYFRLITDLLELFVEIVATSSDSEMAEVDLVKFKLLLDLLA